jgi:hypothetical protein
MVKTSPPFYGTLSSLPFSQEPLEGPCVAFGIYSVRPADQPPSWGATHCRLSATGYSMYSELLFTLGQLLKQKLALVTILHWSAWYSVIMFGCHTEGALKSRDSSVGIALGYGLDDRGSRVRFPAGAGNFFLTTTSRTALGPTQSHIQWVPGALSLEVKRLGREADHSPPSSAGVKECVALYLHFPNTPSWRGA